MFYTETFVLDHVEMVRKMENATSEDVVQTEFQTFLKNQDAQLVKLFNDKW